MKNKMKRILSVALMLFMIIGSLPVFSFAAVTNIPEDAVEFNGHYYKVYDMSKSWSDAKSYCEKIGGHLVTITSGDEQSFMIEITNSSSKKNMWIGAYPKNGNMIWITNEELSYTNWASGEPNNVFNMQNAVMMYTKNASFPAGTWNDENGNGRDWSGYRLSDFGFICEWDTKTTPDGYNFLEDSYQFSNFGTYISKKYFTTMFGKEKGRELWKSSFYQSGVCFGMSYTTAAIYNGLPDVERFAYIDEGFDAKFATKIRDLNKSTLFSQGATVSVGGSYNDYLTLNDYIKYAHVYQCSPEFAQNSVKTDVLTIYNMVKSYLDEDRIGVSITLRKNSGGGHEVLAIGIDGNDILVDDPNNTSSPERIKMGDNGYWSFSGLPGWNSDTCTIEYSLDTYMPYKTLLTGKVLGKTDKNEEENYVSGMDTLAKDELLLTVKNSNSEIASNDILEINPIGYTEDTSETARQYWLMNDKSISVSNTGGEENEVRLAGNGSVLTASMSDNSGVTMTLDGQKAETKIDAVCGNEYTVSVIDFNDAEEAIEAKITGTAAKDTVTAAKTEDGVTVSGLSDITITYLKDDTEFADAKADASDGQETDISIDENDNISVTEQRSACTHICHKGGISKVFYKIARFFWKLFKVNEECSCGAAHY